MANEIYDSTWWGNTIDTASSIGTSTEMIQGQFNLTKLGDELVTNGSFATDSDWIKLNGTTISGGVARVVADGNIEAGSSNWTLKQTVFEENKTYQVTFRARQVSGSGTFQVGRDYYSFVDKVITSSFVEYSFTVNSESLNFDGYLVFGGRTSGDVFEVDNVSVKEVRATTVEAKKCLADTIHRIGLQDIQN